MQELLTFRQMFVLLNDELRRLFNANLNDLDDDETAQLKLLMEFFGLEKCAHGKDSWDTYEEMADELGDDLQMEYEDYVVSDLSHYDLLQGDL